MKHDFIDKYCHLDSPLHRLDPRSKLFFALVLLVIFAATPGIKLFLLYYALLVLGVLLSRVPLSYFLKRMLLVTPLVIMISVMMLLPAVLGPVPPGLLLQVGLIVVKTYASIIMLTLLTSVTRFNCLLWAMRKFGFPSVITTVSRLVYTYTFLLVDELHAGMRALKSRAPVIRMKKTKVYGYLAASILLKSFHRSQSVYYAMVSRKFNGEFPEGHGNRFKGADIYTALFLGSVCALVYLLWNR